MSQTNFVFDINYQAFIYQTAAEGSENTQQNQPGSSSNAIRAHVDLEDGGVVSSPAAVGSIPRKLSATHQTLLVDLKGCAASLSACKTDDNFLTESMYSAVNEQLMKLFLMR